MSEKKKNAHYQRKWARLVTFLTIVSIFLAVAAFVTHVLPRPVLLGAAVVVLILAWFLRLRNLTCQGCGKSCAPLMVKKGTTAVCPYCGTPFVFDDDAVSVAERKHEQNKKKKRR